MGKYPKHRKDSQELDKGEDVSYTWQIAVQRQKKTMPQNQLNSATHLVSVFVRNIQCVFIMLSFSFML